MKIIDEGFFWHADWPINIIKFKKDIYLEMNGILSHKAVLLDDTGPGITSVNEMNFCMNHAPDAASIAPPVDMQSSALRLSIQF